jgi:hypothetical protein
MSDSESLDSSTLRISENFPQQMDHFFTKLRKDQTKENPSLSESERIQKPQTKHSIYKKKKHIQTFTNVNTKKNTFHINKLQIPPIWPLLYEYHRKFTIDYQDSEPNSCCLTKRWKTPPIYRVDTT